MTFSFIQTFDKNWYQAKNKPKLSESYPACIKFRIIDLFIDSESSISIIPFQLVKKMNLKIAMFKEGLSVFVKKGHFHLNGKLPRGFENWQYNQKYSPFCT